MQEPDSVEGHFSILFDAPGGGSATNPDRAPDFFRDLNLDQIVDDITAGREEYNLKPIFHALLPRVADVTYRQEVMRDLENEDLFESVKTFAGRMRVMREHLTTSEKSSYTFHRERWFLDAVEVYCDATASLLRDLSEWKPTSRGLRRFLLLLRRYATSVPFRTLQDEARKLTSGLSEVRYKLLIRDGSITVTEYKGETDYSADVESTFAKFRRGAAKDYLSAYTPSSGMGHVEAALLEMVARLNPQVFPPLLTFYQRHRDFTEELVTDFDREIQFYVAWREYTERFERMGLEFCYPLVSDDCKNISSRGGFDLALAGRLSSTNAPVVCNDFALSGRERILVVTGPNQGGKTTFARAFGQMHYLGGLGLSVPGREARLLLPDRILTQFEREEDISTLRGKLQDDLLRIRSIVESGTASSVIILNEVFSSTTLKDGVYLGKQIMKSILKLNARCVWVTFLDELARFDPAVVSMVAMVEPSDPTTRTYKIERSPAAGLSYAQSIASKYGLTWNRIKERIWT